MDEARRVLERLERIDELRRTGAAPSTVLAEVRGLLEDGERWLAAEGGDVEASRRILERAADRLEFSGGPGSGRRSVVGAGEDRRAIEIPGSTAAREVVAGSSV
ncbi:MAG: hypothetical protein E6G67_02715 [Actinobacteria bacterium]|nr:MAG: hypothetical protein E6G67_02715 [Actinomycetota bacterium]